MTDKLNLKSSHEVIYTVNVADVESIFYCKPTDPDILTVLMKDGKRLYCDEVCPVDSLQEEPVSKLWRDASEEPEFYKEFAIVSTDNVLTASYTLTNHGMSWNGIKEIDKVSKWCYVEDLIYKQEEPVSEELKEAANEAAEKAYPYIGGTKGMICESSKPIFIKGFKTGDKWQKQQTINKACEAFCKAECDGHPPRSTCTSLGTCKKYDDFCKALRED